MNGGNECGGLTAISRLYLDLQPIAADCFGKQNDGKNCRSWYNNPSLSPICFYFDRYVMIHIVQTNRVNRDKRIGGHPEFL